MKSSVVYVVLDSSWRVLYVGTTDDLERRTADHRHREWWLQVARVEVDSSHVVRQDALDRELELIRTARPLHNGTGVPRETRAARMVAGRDLARRPRSRLVTLPDAAAYLGLATSDLAARSLLGTFPAEKISGRWRIPVERLEQWADDFVARFAAVRPGQAEHAVDLDDLANQMESTAYHLAGDTTPSGIAPLIASWVTAIRACDAG